MPLEKLQKERQFEHIVPFLCFFDCMHYSNFWNMFCILQRCENCWVAPKDEINSVYYIVCTCHVKIPNCFENSFRLQKLRRTPALLHFHSILFSKPTLFQINLIVIIFIENHHHHHRRRLSFGWVAEELSISTVINA